MQSGGEVLLSRSHIPSVAFHVTNRLGHIIHVFPVIHIEVVQYSFRLIGLARSSVSSRQLYSGYLTRDVAIHGPPEALQGGFGTFPICNARYFSVQGASPAGSRDSNRRPASAERFLEQR